jgi:DNA-binding NarL/FixJ family response regulator
MESSKIRLFIADDHEVLIESLINLVMEDPEVQYVGRATDGEQLLRLAGVLRPDVILLDIRMPRMNGLEAAEKIKQVHPEIKVLMLTGFATREFVREALSAGASGFISKNKDGAVILDAIKRVYRGEFIIVVDGLPNDDGPVSAPPVLTTRQREILSLIVQGHTNAEIADILHLKIGTVGTYRDSLMQKLGAHNVADLVRLAKLYRLCP